MIALLLGVALAAEPDPGVRPSASLGYEAVTNDPFVFRRGLRLAVGADLGAWVGLELSGSAYPVLGRGDYNAVTRRLVDELHVAPDISRIVAAGRAGLVAWPVRTGKGRARARVGAGVGAALFHTWDDLDAWDTEQASPETNDLTEYTRQTHPGIYGEVRAEGWRGPVGLRVRLETSWYREAIDADTREDKRPLWLGVEVVWRPGGGS